MNVRQVTQFLSVIDSLKHTRHVGFMERANGRAQKLVESMGENCPANLKKAATDFKIAFVGEDSVFKQQRGSDYTARIKEADDLRDTTLSGIKSMLDALSKIGTAEQKEAVVKVQKQLDLYKLRPTDSYEDEGVKLSQFCHDCETNYQIEQALVKLNLKDQVTLLRQQNDECRRLVNLRNEERSWTDNQAMQKARKQTDAAYADFVMLLNAYNVVNFDGQNGYYDECIGYINSDIDYFKTWVLRKQGEDEDGGSQDDGGSDEGGSEDGGSDVKPDETGGKDGGADSAASDAAGE